jgi:hypothetical protein
MRFRNNALCVLSLASLFLAGCRSVEPPTLYPQGTVRQQQYDAQRFDPLPEPDTAPEIVGARGREYERPVAQPSRARWDPRTWVQRWGW